MNDSDKKHWMNFLEDEDLAFVKRFILFSGSLKDLADAYNVSYPTLRLRLGRLIEKIKILDSQKIDDDFERQLRAHFADGKLDSQVFKKLLTAYQNQKKGTKRKNYSRLVYCCGLFPQSPAKSQRNPRKEPCVCMIGKS